MSTRKARTIRRVPAAPEKDQFARYLAAAGVAHTLGCSRGVTRFECELIANRFHPAPAGRVDSVIGEPKHVRRQNHLRMLRPLFWKLPAWVFRVANRELREQLEVIASRRFAHPPKTSPRAPAQSVDFTRAPADPDGARETLVFGDRVNHAD
jgi:hypothetical protein